MSGKGVCPFMLLEDCLKEFIFDCKLRKLSERTIKSYRGNCERLFQFLEREYQVKELEYCNVKCIQGYIQFLTNQGLKESYINSIIKCVTAFFEYCYKEEYVHKNVMKKIRYQKEPITLIETFTNEEVHKMILYYGGSRFLDYRNKLIMIMLFDSGIRNSELCDIKMDDIKESHIVINGKGKKIRHVPITAIINKFMIKYLRSRENYIKDKIAYQKEYLFLSQKGKKLTVETIENIVRNCGVGCDIRSDIRCSPHTCRHFYAQSQLKNGCDLFTVSKLLGHNNINITKRYLNSINDDDFYKMAIRTSPLSNL